MKTILLNISSLLTAVAFVLASQPVLANHHGVACPLDLQVNADHFLPVVNEVGRAESSASLIAAGESDFHELQESGHWHQHELGVPAIGAAYSVPVDSAAACIVPLPDNAGCPAISWCYPYKQNIDSIQCSTVPEVAGKAEAMTLACESQAHYCIENPNSLVCAQPDDEKFECLADPTNSSKLCVDFRTTLLNALIVD